MTYWTVMLHDWIHIWLCRGDEQPQPLTELDCAVELLPGLTHYSRLTLLAGYLQASAACMPPEPPMKAT